MQKVQIDHVALFEQIHTHAPIGVAVMSIGGKWLKVNPAFCSLTGYTENELTGLTSADIAHPEDIETEALGIRTLLEGDSTVFEMEKRYRTRGGGSVWTSTQLSLAGDERDNKPLYILCYIQETSRSKANAAEQGMMEAGELYRLITEHAWDIISCSNSDGIIQYCSPSVRELLGYEPEEVIGQSNIELYHPQDLESIQASAFADNGIFTYRIRHKDGHYLWFETTTTIIRDEQGRIRNIFGISRDISERKNTEENLAEAQRIAALGSWDWDIIQQEIRFSDQLYRILNLDIGGLPDDLLSLFHPEDRELIPRHLQEAMKSDSYSAEFRSLQPDGSVKYLNTRVSVTFDESGAPVKMNGITQDITESKKIELKLQESIERYTSLKKYNHDAVLSLDLEGNIINTNAMAEKLTGYSIQEMIGMKVSVFIGADKLSRILSDEIMAERQINAFNHKDGHSTEVLTTLAPIIINKKNVGWYIIAKDITEQRKLLIAKEAAENTNKAKSEFLAMMSHEIRTPMNGVIGMTDLLLESTSLDEKQQEYVQIISKSGNTLLNIINDILDFSKIESGRTEMLEIPFNIMDCLNETLGILLPRAQEKNLEIHTYFRNKWPETLIGDPERLKQVLMNLIGNAVKFTDNGSIAVSIERLTDDDDQVRLKFVIKDTGIGIPQEKIKHLFEPFYRVDDFMIRKTEGTGLGLAISKKLIGLLGGEIWVEQAEPQGTVFAFTVRLRKAGQQTSLQLQGSESEGNAQGSNQQALNILIAEDNKVNQLVLQKMLESQGHLTSIAVNGSEVVQMAEAGSYDIIFMDVQMPVMNGLEAAEMIKRTLPPESCPYIIAVTANALKGDQEKCLAAGMDAYMSKPIKSATIAEFIEVARRKTS